MLTPTPSDLAIRPGLVPIEELAERLAEAIAAVAKHQRNATVTLTYKVAWNSDTQRLYLSVASKSKRPVKTNRNEEVIGDDVTILALKQEHAGQQWVPGTGPDDLTAAARAVRDLKENLDRHGATLTFPGKDGEPVKIAGKGKAKA